MSLYLNVFNHAGKIYERYVDANNVERKRIVDDYKPSLFIENANATSDYETIYGVKCIKRTYDSISAAKQAAHHSPIKLLGQEDYVLQYISDQYKGTTDLSQYINQIRIANIDIEVPAPKFPSPNQAEFEVTSIDHYDSVTNLHTVFVVATKSQKWSKELSILDEELLKTVVYEEFPDEKSMMIAYLRFWRENCPAIVTGYNTDGFDIPYLYNRYENILSKKIADKMSPWDKVKKTLKIEWPIGISSNAKTDELKDTLMEKNKYHYDIKLFGIESLDWLSLYKKFSFTPQPSYRLDAIGESEIGENKIHFRHNFMEVYGKSEIIQKKIYEDSHTYEHYAYMKYLLNEAGYSELGTTPEVKSFISNTESSLLNVKEHLDTFKLLIEDKDNRCAELYEYVKSKTVQLAFQMVTDYNVKDVDLVNRMDKVRGFINLAISIAYYAKINFGNVFSPIKTWDAIIFNSVKQHKVVLPASTGAYKQRYIGGFVKQPINGLKKLVASFDLESLYPSIIRQVNISPETFVLKQLPDIDHSEMPSVLMNEEYGELMHCIDKLLNGKMIYDNSEYSLSASGASYRKDILGVIPTEINKVFQERKIYKGIMFKHKHNVTAIKNELKRRGEL